MNKYSKCVLEFLKKPFFSWPAIIFLISFIGILPYANEMLKEGDTLMHVAIGNWIIDHQLIPKIDYFSYTKFHSPWVAHEWMSECLMAIVYNYSGWIGLVALTLACFATTLSFLLRFLLERMEPAHAIFLTLLAGFMAMSHLSVRPHVLTWPIMMIWFVNLIKSSEKNSSPPWYLLLIIPLWVNLHGGFVIGLAFLLAFMIEASFTKLNLGKLKFNHEVFKKWFLFSITAILLSAINPVGFDLIHHALSASNLKILKNITEWAPANFASMGVFRLWLLIILAVSILGFIRISFLRLILLLGLVNLACLHMRFVSILGLISPLLIASSIGQTYKEKYFQSIHSNSIDRFFLKYSQKASPLVYVLSISLILLSLNIANLNVKYQPNRAIYPSDALNTVRNSKLFNGHVLNIDRFAGYLIMNNIKVFDDGRVDLYGDDFEESVINALYKGRQDELVSIISRYKISWTLLPVESPANQFFQNHADWTKIYYDDLVVVYGKNE